VPADNTDHAAPEGEEASRPGFASGAGRASVRAPQAGGGPKRPPRRAGRSGATNGSANGGLGGGADGEDASDDAPQVLATALLEPGTDLTDPLGHDLSEPIVTPVARVAPGEQAAPVPVPERSGRRRVRRGRRVKRVVRRIDLWSVLKLSLVVYTCLYLATLATLTVLWKVLYTSGTIEKLQSCLEDVGLANFSFYGNPMFRACAAIGAIGVMAGTVITVLATALVNVISELTGGIRLVVIEEDTTS
jgi:hypothetical protein